MRKELIAVFVSAMLVCSVLVLTSGCAKKQIPVAPPEEVVTETIAPEPTPDTDAILQARLDDLNAEAQAEKEAQAQRDADTEAIRAEKIYFDYDSSELSMQSQETLKRVAAILESNPSYSLDIAGNCDERGTIEYNLALGERRARAATKFLVTLGIAEDRLTTISYGEEKPVDPRSTEEAWAKNRRDDFKLIK